MDLYMSEGNKTISIQSKKSLKLSSSLNKYSNLTSPGELIDPKIRYSTKKLLSPLIFSNTNKNSAADEWKHFVILASQKPFSNIPSGLDTFKLLDKIKSKDPHFVVPVINSVIFHCGFDKIMLFDSENNLKSEKCYELEEAIQFLKGTCNSKSISTQKSDFPLFVFKYRNCKLLKFAVADLPCNSSELKTDLIIQKFIMPKGLRVSKHRVIINKFQKVMIYSNKIRIDSKADCKNSQKKGKSIDLGIFKDKKHEKKGKIGLKGSNNFSEENKQKKTEKLSDSERFIVNKKIEKTNFFIGKNQSFSEIIKISEYLWRKINFYYLDNSRLTELVCDFMQDEFGKWYFIKIVYGTTEMKEKRKKMRVRICDKPKIILKTAGGMLNQVY